jgi:hypothetical protein
MRQKSIAMCMAQSAEMLALRDTQRWPCKLCSSYITSLIQWGSYLNGKKIDYTGSKTAPAMSAWVRKVIAPGVISVDDAEFTRKLEKEEVVFLLLHSGSDNRVVVSAAIIKILSLKFDPLS